MSDRDGAAPGGNGNSDLLAGKYELLELAGRGGMATVWRGVVHGEAGFTRRIAIKRMQPALSDNEEFAAMFVDEARVVADLTHPNIVQVYDFCRDGRGVYFIVMEWIEGEDLGTVLGAYRRHGLPIPWQAAADIGAAILRGLGAAHGRADAPVFHRDVTPGNVMLSVHGEVKLADFGLARAMDRVTLTVPGVVKGKLAYVAPEMVAGVRASAGTDSYSLGVVLWESLAGRRLFEGKNPVELFVKVGQAKIPPLDELRPDVPAALVEVISKLVAKRPERRYATATEGAEALEAAVMNEPRKRYVPELVQRARQLG